jgi:hypothetical protein
MTNFDVVNFDRRVHLGLNSFITCNLLTRMLALD